MNTISTQTKQTMSSLEIAKLTGKEHPKVTADIKRILDEVGINPAVFGGVYKAGNGQEQPCFNLPRRECDLIIAGYSAKYRLAIIDRWQELEASGFRLPKTLGEALLLAGKLATENEALRISEKISAEVIQEKAGEITWLENRLESEIEIGKLYGGWKRK